MRRVKNNVQSLTVCLLKSNAAESSPKVVSPGCFRGGVLLSLGCWLPELTLSRLEKGGEKVVLYDDGDGESKVLRPRNGGVAAFFLAL